MKTTITCVLFFLAFIFLACVNPPPPPPPSVETFRIEGKCTVTFNNDTSVTFEVNVEVRTTSEEAHRDLKSRYCYGSYDPSYIIDEESTSYFNVIPLTGYQGTPNPVSNSD